MCNYSVEAKGQSDQENEGSVLGSFVKGGVNKKEINTQKES